MTALIYIGALVVTYVALGAIERRHAARERERLAVLRRLREWRPTQPPAAPRDLARLRAFDHLTRKGAA